MADEIFFEIIDKTRRKIRLTKKQGSHIRQNHPEVENEEVIKETVLNPNKITQPYEGKKYYFYKYFKHRKGPDKYLMVIVKYINGDGFIITSFYVNYIR